MDLWIYDSNRGLRTRFTFSPADDAGGAWSSNRDRYAFGSNRESGQWDLYLKEVGGTGEAELLLSNGNMKFPSSWTPDDRMILYEETAAGEETDLFALAVEGDREPIRLTESQFGEGDPSVSPDGRWLVYSSNESGQREVYVTTFPQAERKWQVSVGGGRNPRWTKGGAEIVYLAGTSDSVYAVEVGAVGNTFDVGAIKKLFDVELRGDIGQDWDVTADGERFLINQAPERSRVSALHFVSNWPAILEDQ
jgi:Tol biopolymer transport system component